MLRLLAGVPTDDILDGTHLLDKYQGILLVITRLNSNCGMFSRAIYVRIEKAIYVRIENKESGMVLKLSS